MKAIQKALTVFLVSSLTASAAFASLPYSANDAQEITFADESGKAE